MALAATHCDSGDEGDDFEVPPGFTSAQLALVPATPGAFRREGADLVAGEGGDPSALRLEARVGCELGAGLRVATTARPEAYVDLVPELPAATARAAKGCGRLSRDGALAAFEGAYGPGVTSVLAAGPRHVEEFVRVPSPELMPPLRYRLRGGPGFGHWEADEEGGLWSYAADGAPLVHVPPPALDDAAGAHVVGRWTLTEEGGASTIAADIATEGLTFPLLVDPAFETPAWFRASTVNEPPARAAAAGAYHAADGCVLLYGGLGASGLLGDTRVRCAGAWQAGDRAGQLRPSGRAHTALADVPAAGGASGPGLYLFGGVTAAGVTGDDEFWRVTLSGPPGDKTAIWHRIERGAGPWPRARYFHGMAWDGARLVLWGGVARDGTLLGDTWTWDGTKWAELPCAASTCFRPRYAFAAGHVGTAASPTIYAFGGYEDDNTPPRADGGGWYRNTLQRFDGTGWSFATAANATLPLAASGAVDNAAPLAPEGRTVPWLVRTAAGGLLLGSGAPAAGSLSDLWAWSPSGAARWQRLPSVDAAGAANPGRRLAASAVYDESTGETLLFGGMDATTLAAGRIFRPREHQTAASVTCLDSVLDAGSTCAGPLDKYLLQADVYLDGGLVTNVLRARGYFLRRKNGVWEEIPSLLGSCGSAAAPLTAALGGGPLRLSCQVGWDAGVDAFAVRTRDQAYYGFGLAGLPISGALCETAPVTTSVPYCNAATSYAGAASCTTLPATNNAAVACQ